MKKLFACMLCLALLCSIFTGCGATEDSSSTTSSAVQEEENTATETTPASQEAADETTEEATPGSDASTAEKVQYTLPLTTEGETFTFFIGVAPFLNGIVSGFDENIAWSTIQENTGVNIEFMNVSGMNESTQFQLLLAAEDLPDIVQRCVAMYGSAQGAIENEIVINIADYAEYCPNFLYYLNQNETIRKMATSDAGIASFVQFKTDIMFNEGYAIRQDWLEEVGMDAPSTYDEIYDVLKAFQTELGVEHPFATTYSEGALAGTFSNGFGVQSGVMVRNGEVTWGLLSEEYYDFLCMMKQWYDEGLIDPESYSYTGASDYQDDALTGECGFYYRETNLLSTLIEQNADPDAAIQAIDYPVLNEGDELHFSPMIINELEGKDTFVNTQILSITTNCDNIPLAVQLIDYCYSDEGGMICNYGVEGDTYELVDGEPQFTEKVLNNDLGISLENSFNVFCLQYGPFVEDYNRVSDNWDDIAYAAALVWSSSNLGESWQVPTYGVELTTEENEEYSMIYADIQTYISENLWRYIDGTYSLDDYFDTFVADIESMNIDRCIEIYQAAYDRYISN